MVGTASGSDDSNKSAITVDDSYRDKKGIPAGRPGRDEDMAQAALMLAVNQYAYGQTIAIDGGYLLEHP
jgi:NAD(P)-dependent dehydrogenase (short-subunit alcohol dehydrogenase family)